MKRYFSFLLVAWVSLSIQAQMPRWNSVYQAYIDQYKDIAIEQMLKYRIPASITLAQGLLESGAGKSSLAVKGNNHFGIKCHDWLGKTMYKDDDASNECFRVYDNVLQSFEDHSKFLRQHKRYASLFDLRTTDYAGWAVGLKRCGYATSPTYAQSLINIIEVYNLSQYDHATSYDSYIVQRSRNGDTFKSIGNEVQISGRSIAKYNERGYHDTLKEGDIIYLKKKQKRADKEYKGIKHTVQPGESMYLISQRYGIRLKNLYKMNKLSPDYQLRVGDQLRVY